MGISHRCCRSELRTLARVRIRRKPLNVPMTRPCPPFVPQKKTGKPLRELAGDLLQREHAARTGRAFDHQSVAVKLVVTFERLDDQEVDLEPDRPAPVRVSAEKVALPLPGT